MTVDKSQFQSVPTPVGNPVARQNATPETSPMGIALRGMQAQIDALAAQQDSINKAIYEILEELD